MGICGLRVVGGDMNRINQCNMDTPIGNLVIEENGEAIVALHIAPKQEKTCETPLLQEAKRQLQEYFAGKRREFALPVALDGTEFRRKVWEVLRTIPYGETRSYGEVAAAVGNPKASRAVGGANHNNPVMIIVPCHRVIGADGSLTGFGGGLSAKEYLLSLERKYCDKL